jgi:hypothetical protein
MTDGKRFLRYIVPGSVFFIELGLIIAGLLPDWTYLKIKSILTAENFDGGTAAGVAIGYFVTSGALGFLFNTIHHTLYWTFAKGYPAADYRNFDHKVFRAELSEPQGASPLQGGTREYMNAWIVVTKLWHERIETDCNIKSANPRADSFADIVHGLGSCRVALWSGFVTAVTFVANFFIIHGRLGLSPYWAAGAFLAIVGMSLPFVGGRAYRQALRLSDHFVLRILRGALDRSG